MEGVTSAPLLIVFAGLPCTGKTSLARAVARKLRAAYLDRDSIGDATLAIAREVQCEHGPALAGRLSYDVLVTLARDNLTLGVSVVLDSPADSRSFREKTAQLARDVRAELKVIECICTDETLLRERVVHRRRHLPPSESEAWQAFQQEQARFERLTGPRLIVDTAEAQALNLRKVLGHLGAESVAGPS